MHYTQEERPPDWENFVKDNAVVLVSERDKKIQRYREEITRLENSRREMRRHIRALNERIEKLQRLAMEQ